MKKIGLVIATATEFNNIFNSIADEAIELSKVPFEVHKLIIKDKEIYAIHSRCGESFASAATQHLIDKYNVEVILNYGVVGALTDDLVAHDTVIVDKVIDYGFDTSPIDNCKIGEHVEFNTHDPYLYPSKELNKLVLDNFKDLISVTCASGNKFLADPKEKEFLNKEYGASICEMEASGILLTCYINNVPSLFVKGVSDSKHGGAEEFHKMIKSSSHKAFEILLKIINTL